MSLQHVKDTPTKRLFERKFEFWIPRKFMVDNYTNEVSGVYSSGVAEIDDMAMNEEVPAQLTVPQAAEKHSRGVPMRIANPDVNAMKMFMLLLEHTEYVKYNLENDPNARVPSLEASRILEEFMGGLWNVARGRIKDPTEMSGLSSRLREIGQRRKIGINRARRGGLNAGPTVEEQLQAVRHSEFRGTKIEEFIIQQQQRGR
ncbi:hypothetical protein ACQCZE_23535 [Escherichia coli]|jgi:hypothetical protein|uniref:Uncharacterized protein n=4 Tax=root TaxID=1 RepID=A0A482GI83_BPGOS|nr:MULTISPECIES: hypothetical protein [Enterobacteriaceae]YP_009820734.1 hypothetical protein HOV27_gp049 [Escherichia phage vB_EcoM_Goslar]ECA2613838.1 hypothetical protein [Salmonella enterica subsp. enterica serovar Enteritidis]ECB6911653.1 hypothetical protein [Salmonella enterica subsp. enterica serovar Kingston]ECN7988355.1 hypothetical protein [Salmonella enterica subsp. enterica serovar Corvallis]EDH9938775.1 hypothetical protein [Salmonella enterica subsp. enterica serovar Newport]ED